MRVWEATKTSKKFWKYRIRFVVSFFYRGENKLLDIIYKTFPFEKAFWIRFELIKFNSQLFNFQDDFQVVLIKVFTAQKKKFQQK